MNKTILITGSTDGIGKLAAIQLAQAGHSVFIHGRNEEKLHAVIGEIQEISNNKQVDGFVADFSSLAQVKDMAKAVQEKLNQLDVLINNAGVFNSSMVLNEDGIDLRMVVNYLAPFRLTHDLIPLLEKGSQPRIINLSSAAQAPVSFDILKGNAAASERETYAQSKLALTMWSFSLAKSLREISVIALNPGSLLNTRMVQEAFGTFWAPADKGAHIIFELAVSERHAGITGKYFDNDAGNYGKAHADAYDPAKIESLIQETNMILGIP